MVVIISRFEINGIYVASERIEHQIRVKKENILTNLKWRLLRTAKTFEPKTPEMLIEFEPSNATVRTDFAKSM